MLRGEKKWRCDAEENTSGRIEIGREKNGSVWCVLQTGSPKKKGESRETSKAVWKKAMRLEEKKMKKPIICSQVYGMNCSVLTIQPTLQKQRRLRCVSSSLRIGPTANLALVNFQMSPARILLKFNRLGNVEIVFIFLFHHPGRSDMDALNENLFVFGNVERSSFDLGRLLLCAKGRVEALAYRLNHLAEPEPVQAVEDNVGG